MASAHEQIPLPVAGHRPVGDVRGPLLNTEHVRDNPTSVVNVPSALPVLAPVPQSPQQLPLELAPGQHVQVGVDRLVRHAHGRIIRIRLDQPLGHLLRPPALRQLGMDIGACSRPWTTSFRGRRGVQLATEVQWGAAGRSVGPRRQGRLVQFPRDGAGRATELLAHRSHAHPSRHVAADVFALGEGQLCVTLHPAQLFSPGDSQEKRVALKT